MLSNNNAGLLARSVALFFFLSAVHADGTLTDDIRISSRALGYDLQYRVYLPEGADAGTEYPVLFLTDGHRYLDPDRGHMGSVLDKLIRDASIEPIVAVFVDPRNPDNLDNNRRRRQFLGNEDYLRFFTDELIPAIERNYPVIANRKGRSIMGLSFGGTNAACFGLSGSGTFSGIAMQSPANHPVPWLLPGYRIRPRLPLKIFLSTGRPNDNTEANRFFHRVLEEKGYEMKYIEVDEGHNWHNWRSLIDDALLYFYGTDS